VLPASGRFSPDLLLAGLYSLLQTQAFSSRLHPFLQGPAFESLCLDLWKDIWQDSGAQNNGRRGQKQDGVDIFGRENGEWEDIHGAATALCAALALGLPWTLQDWSTRESSRAFVSSAVRLV
jgi:hypothetical protein